MLNFKTVHNSNGWHASFFDNWFDVSGERQPKESDDRKQHRIQNLLSKLNCTYVCAVSGWYFSLAFLRQPHKYIRIHATERRNDFHYIFSVKITAKKRRNRNSVTVNSGNRRHQWTVTIWRISPLIIVARIQCEIIICWQTFDTPFWAKIRWQIQRMHSFCHLINEKQIKNSDLILQVWLCSTNSGRWNWNNAVKMIYQSICLFNFFGRCCIFRWDISLCLS